MEEEKMSRTKGAFEYMENAEDMIESLVKANGKTTKMIMREAKDTYFKDISFNTTKRLLTSLLRKGRMKVI